MRRFVGLLAFSSVLVVGLAASWLALAQTAAQSDQSTLASLLSRVLSTPANRVRIGAVDGALSSNAVIRDVTIADEDGVWLRLDRASIVWSRTALLRGRLHINELVADRLDYIRPPAADRERPSRAEGPLLPEPPVELIVDRFEMRAFALGEAVLGTSARLRAEGRARLGDAAQGLALTFRMQRLDAPGRAAIELAYVPQTSQLALDLAYSEPEGGIAARALDLPGLPPVELSLAGNAPLANFDARLRFLAGPTIGAEGQATVRRGERDYRVTLGFDARIDGLVPTAIAPVFRGTTRLAGTTVLADDGAVAIEGLRLGAPLAALEVNGRMTATRELDVRVTGGAVPTDGTVTRADGAEIGRLALDLSVAGPLAAPRVNGTVEAADITVPEGRLDRLDLRLATQPIGEARPAERFSITLDAAARGIAPRDAALARAIGGEVRAQGRGIAATDGRLTIDTASVETPTASGRFSGTVAPDAIDGRLQARVPQLSAFAELSGAALRGEARLDVALSGDPSRSQLRLGLDGRLTRFGTGLAFADGLFGRDVALTGAIQQMRRGFGYEALRLRGDNLDVTFDGSATREAADLRVALIVAELRRLDQRIGGGRAELRGQLAGSLQRPTLTATAKLIDVVALGRPVPRLDVALQARNLTDGIEATLSLDGDVEGQRARGQALARQLADGAIMLERLDLSVGSVALRGAGRLDAQGLASGDVSLSARDLSDIAPLLLTPLSGNLNAAAQLAVSVGDQDARITAEGARLRIGDNQLAAFSARLALTGLYRRPVIDGTVAADTLTVGGQSFRRIRLTAQGAASGSAFTAAMEAQGFNLSARGRLVPDAGGAHRVELAAFEAVRQRRRFALAGPAVITVQPGGAQLSNVVVTAESGRIAVAGDVGTTLDLTVEARAVPLSIVEVFAPGTGLAGTLDANARIQGEAARPTGDYRLRITRLALPALRQSGVAALDIAATGRLADGRVGVDGTVSAARAGTVRVNGSIPMSPDGALDLAVNGRIDLAVANVILSADGRRVGGAATLDLTLTGRASQPVARGTVTIANGSFADELQGVRVSAIAAVLRAEGDAIRVERFSARTPNGGALTASGRVSLNADAGFPGELRITGRRAQLAANPTYTAMADLDLALSGPLARAPSLTGRIGIVSLDVTVPDRLPATLQPLPNTRHVRPPPQAQARLARDARRTARRAGRAPFEARLDLTVTALNRIFVRGRGINAELGGDIRLTGTSRDPVAIGAFELRRGRLDLLGQRLDFRRGRLDFTGDLTPSLDFLAETQAGEVTARIAVTGPANAPTFALSSTPELPQDEVLSRILFNRAAGGLSAGQALQLASAVATLAGGSGGGAFEQVRRSLGVDSLDVSAGAGGPAVGVSRYITDNVRLGVRGGANPADSGVTVDIDLTRRVRVQGEAGASGRTSVGVGVEWEW
jgi:translocation and assembly module TamB